MIWLSEGYVMGGRQVHEECIFSSEPSIRDTSSLLYLYFFKPMTMNIVLIQNDSYYILCKMTFTVINEGNLI